jgi:hypothetical protein
VLQAKSTSDGTQTVNPGTNPVENGVNGGREPALTGYYRVATSLSRYFVMARLRQSARSAAA